APTVHGHTGVISIGLCVGCPLLLFRGRVHRYEGHEWHRVTALARLASEWEIRILLLTNAAGGIHESLGPGDLMVVRDHLFLQLPNAWKDVNKPKVSAYSPRLIDLLQRAERSRGRNLMAGVYVAVTGPCYETPAEIRALKAMGADAVGMSTAAEADMAVSLGVEGAALSGVTNKAAGLAAGTLDHAEVLPHASRPADRSSDWLATIVPQLG